MKKNIMFMVAGILLLVTTGIIYIPKFMNQGLLGIELTFLSNFVTGILFLWDGLRGILTKKRISQECYLAADSILFCVLIITVMCFGEANFSGAFLFLHIINPILTMVLVILCTYQEGIKLRRTFVGTLVIAVVYLAYVICYGYCSGDWLYSVINVPEKGVISVAIFSLIFFVFIPVLEYAIYRGSKWVHKRRQL